MLIASPHCIQGALCLGLLSALVYLGNTTLILLWSYPCTSATGHSPKKSPKQVAVFALWRERNFTDACFAVRSLKLNKHSCHHLASFYIQSVRQFPSKLQKLLSGRSRMIYFFQHNILFPLKSNTYQYEVFALYLVNPKNIAVTQGFSDLQEIPLKILSLS